MNKSFKWHEFARDNQNTPVIEETEDDLPRIRGVVLMWNQEKHYGFLKRESHTYFFHESDVRGELLLSRGDQVEFTVASDPKKQGSVRAVDIQFIRKFEDYQLPETPLAPPDAVEKRGIVESFDSSKGFGFISVEGLPDRTLVHHTNVVPDCIGRRNLQRGCEVCFKLAPDINNKLKAFEVSDISPQTASINWKEYREVGQVERWDPATGYGWVRRPNGEGISMSIKNVIAGIESVKVDQWIRYAIRSRYKFTGKRAWWAGLIEILDADYIAVTPGSIEEFFLRNAPDPEPIATETATETRSVLLRPENRTKTLRELCRKQLVA